MMLLSTCSFLLLIATASCKLRPQDSESRESKNLDGAWTFRLGDHWNPNQGFDEKWFDHPLTKSCQDKGDCNQVMMMPVPSSYNDITTNATIRDFVGWVWYDREFFAPAWDVQSNNVFLRFGSVHFTAKVYLNGVFVGQHEGGHLPFEFDVSGVIQPSQLNLVTVAVNNTLTDTTLPQGQMSYHHNDPNYPPNFYQQNINFDFFNYAGIHRSVVLYTVPSNTYIDDLTVVTSYLSQDHSVAVLSYEIKVKGDSNKDPKCGIALSNRAGHVVAMNYTTCKGTLQITNPRLWWPYTMKDNDYGYLHELVAFAKSPNSPKMDTYRLKIGIRTVAVNATTMLVNGQEFYMRGFGRHEDSDIRGKGLDYALIARDFELIRWIGANSFRTSHYPYAEEIMDAADENGIVIVDECPGVSLDFFSEGLLESHLKGLNIHEFLLIRRLKSGSNLFSSYERVD